MKLPEESVWDYPRPPLCEPVDYELKVVLAGQIVAQTKSGFRVCETSHPPTYYIPPDDITPEALQPVEGSSLCEFKGKARYFDVRVGDHVVERSAWAYDTPTAAFREIAGYLCFYAEGMEACSVNGELVKPQPGNFYGGWITANLKGPFKGVPGSMLW